MPFDPLSNDPLSNDPLSNDPHSNRPLSNATVPARAALAGNPSDGYGGRVVAAVVPELQATVTVEAAAAFRVGDVEFEAIEQMPELQESGEAALFLGSLTVAARRWPVAPCMIEWTTSIPRSVGLAGSSALVLATLQALAAANHQVIDPSQLPQMALAAEKLMGITAGLQDRVVQTFGDIQDMTFATRTAVKQGSPSFTQRNLVLRRQLDLAILFDTSTAEPSQVFHGQLRQRYDDGDQQVRNAMHALARAAETAAQSIETGDLKQLGVAMNESFDLRASMSDLSPSHIRLVELARSCGLATNYAGSGGAVVGLITPASAMDRLSHLAEREQLGLHRWSLFPQEKPRT